MALLSGVLLLTIFTIVSSKSIISNDLIYGQPEQVHLSYGRRLNLLKISEFLLYHLSRSITHDRHMGNIK
jgi:hypothetical protein